MSKPSVVTLRMPHTLKAQIAKLANQEGVSLNQFIVHSLVGIASKAETIALMEEIKGGRSAEEIFASFDKTMVELRSRQSLSDEEVPEWDRMPESL